MDDGGACVVNLTAVTQLGGVRGQSRRRNGGRSLFHRDTFRQRWARLSDGPQFLHSTHHRGSSSTSIVKIRERSHASRVFLLNRFIFLEVDYD
jgi:hypothetical protein